MAASCDLNVAKENLHEALGDKMKIYLQNLKSWFKQKISKEDFDSEARNLLDSESVNLHNEFLLAIIAKCQSLSSSLVPKESSIAGKSFDQSKHSKPKPKLKRRSVVPRGAFQQRFVPINPIIYAQDTDYNYRGIEDTAFAARDLTLPDITMVHGRVLVCAWETGLDDVVDEAVKLVMQAVESQLKNIISMVLSSRNGYKVREKKFRFAVGTQIQNPYLRHTSLIEDTAIESEATAINSSGSHVPCRRPPLEIGEGSATQQLSAASMPLYKGSVSLYDLLHTLQLYKSAIPSHTVYAPAIERIIHKLWHPSNEDMAQEIIHQQEVTLRHQLNTDISLR